MSGGPKTLVLPALVVSGVVALAYVGVLLREQSDGPVAARESVEASPRSAERAGPLRRGEAPRAVASREPPEGTPSRAAEPVGTEGGTVDAEHAPAGPAHGRARPTEPARRKPVRSTAQDGGAPDGRVADRRPGNAIRIPGTGGAADSRDASLATTAGLPSGLVTATQPRMPAASAGEQTEVVEDRADPEVEATPPAAPEDPAPAVPRDPPRAGPTRRDVDDSEPVPAPVVRMLAAATEIAVGDRFTLTIEISGAADVGHVPFHISMDPRVLQFEYGEEGSFLRSDGRPTAFFAAATGDAAAVVVGLSRLGQGDGIRGGGDLCVLHFNAVGPGNAGLAFAHARVRDSGNRIVPAQFFDAAVVVR